MTFSLDERANAALPAAKRAFLARAIASVVDATRLVGQSGTAVPPAYLPVAVAQLLLESGWGTSQLALLGQNYFGVKARDGEPAIVFPTTEHLSGQDVRVKAAFRKYASMTESCAAHCRLLCTAPAYAGARAHPDDPRAFALALQGRYATDPDYGAKLAAVMASRGLLRTFGFPA